MAEKRAHVIDGAKSDTDAMRKIIGRLEDGYVLTEIGFCKASSCSSPVHLHFRLEEKSPR